MMKIKYLLVLIVLLSLAGTSAHSLLFSGRNTVEKVRAKIARLPEEGKSKTKGILYSDLGLLLYKRGEFQEAVKAFHTALDYKTSRKIKREIYLYMGKSYESYARLDKAIPAYEKALQYDPKEWKRHRDLARLYEKVKLYDKAVKTFSAAIERNEKSASLHFSLGRVYRKLGLFAKAEVELNHALELGYSEQFLSEEISYIYEGQGRYGEALLAYAKGIYQDSPSKDWARYVYLAVLSNNKTFANQGMDQLQTKSLADGSLHFYETLVQMIGREFDDILAEKSTDVTIQRLFDVINQEK